MGSARTVLTIKLRRVWDDEIGVVVKTRKTAKGGLSHSNFKYNQLNSVAKYYLCHFLGRGYGSGINH